MHSVSAPLFSIANHKNRPINSRKMLDNPHIQYECVLCAGTERWSSRIFIPLPGKWLLFSVAAIAPVALSTMSYCPVSSCKLGACGSFSGLLGPPRFSNVHCPRLPFVLWNGNLRFTRMPNAMATANGNWERLSLLFGDNGFQDATVFPVLVLLFLRGGCWF